MSSVVENLRGPWKPQVEHCLGAVSIRFRKENKTRRKRARTKGRDWSFFLCVANGLGTVHLDSYYQSIQTLINKLMLQIPFNCVFKMGKAPIRRKKMDSDDVVVTCDNVSAAEVCRTIRSTFTAACGYDLMISVYIQGWNQFHCFF